MVPRAKVRVFLLYGRKPKFELVGLRSASFPYVPWLQLTSAELSRRLRRRGTDTDCTANRSLRLDTGPEPKPELELVPVFARLWLQEADRSVH